MKSAFSHVAMAAIATFYPGIASRRASSLMTISRQRSRRRLRMESLEQRRLLAYTTIVNNGNSNNRVDIVFMGDGYVSSQLGTGSIYETHINSMLNHMFNAGQDPYPRYENFFNVHRIDVVSNQSGADVPPENVFRDTALDASYFWDNVTDRLLYVNHFTTLQVRSAALAGAPFAAEMQLITVNSTRYGGGGGAFAVYAGGNSSATEVALHELGHSFNGLADEYGGFTQPYTGGEPSELNVSKNSSGAKWSQWLGYVQPVIGTIGAFQGARYYDVGLYRPSNSSKMRALGRPFDAVSREEIVLDIYDYVNPLDAWRSNAAVISGSDLELWVEVIDPNVLNVEWYVDGNLIAGANGETFDLLQYGYGPGTYTVTARAYDPTTWVRIDLQQLEQSVQWTVLVDSQPTGSVMNRLLFYDNSAFDVGGDNGAISNKTALAAGTQSTTANYSNYVRGINGVMVDLAGAANSAAITANDFVFRIGTTNNPSFWQPISNLAGLQVLPGAGASGSDRIVLTWLDLAISNTWLEVRLLANANTSLGADDVFYFGNQIADVSGDGNVNATDYALVRNNFASFLNPAALNNAYDLNHDKRVNAADLAVVRDHATMPQRGLPMINPQSSLQPGGGLLALDLAEPNAVSPVAGPVNIRQRQSNPWNEFSPLGIPPPEQPFDDSTLAAAMAALIDEQDRKLNSRALDSHEENQYAKLADICLAID